MIFGLTGTVGLGWSFTGVVTAPVRAHAEQTVVPAAPPHGCRPGSIRSTRRPCRSMR
ncbi:MAG TPA: hypothetical protein VGG05_25355 [Pseudonocardiaceae bacterium]|jgi:hypothetical protein